MQNKPLIFIFSFSLYSTSIPDFVPVLGYIDDLILIPIGIALSIKLIPKDIIEYCKKESNNLTITRRLGIYAGSVIVLIWLVLFYLAISKII